MTPSKAQKTAAKIMDSATELFTQRGFFNVSIKEIAVASGTNSALISYYFGGKTELYAAIIMQQAEKITNLQKTVMADFPTALGRIFNYIIGIKDIQSQSTSHATLLYRELTTPSGLCNEVITSRLEVIHNFTVEQIKIAIKEKTIKASVEPSYSAFILEGIIVLTFLTREQLHLLNPDKKVTDSVIQDVVEYYFKPLLTGKEKISHGKN